MASGKEDDTHSPQERSRHRYLKQPHNEESNYRRDVKHSSFGHDAAQRTKERFGSINQ
jgi:hypothetical protein